MYLKKYLISLLIGIGMLSWCTLQQQEEKTLPVEDQWYYQKIFVLWDSLSAGYKLAYEDSYPAQLEKKLQDLWYKIKVINGGESGDTSAGLKSRLDRVTAQAVSGDIALIVIGGNDGLQWLSTDLLKQNIRDIIQTLQSRNISTIIWWMQIPTNLGESYRSAFSSLYPVLAQETDSLLIPFILSGVAGIPELNLADRIHPNATGQNIVAQTVFDTLLNSSLLQLP